MYFGQTISPTIIVEKQHLIPSSLINTPGFLIYSGLGFIALGTVMLILSPKT